MFKSFLASYGYWGKNYFYNPKYWFSLFVLSLLYFIVAYIVVPLMELKYNLPYWLGIKKQVEKENYKNKIEKYKEKNKNN